MRLVTGGHKDIHFSQFLQTRDLKIPRLEKLGRPASAFITFLYKAQQLQLDYELTQKSVLLESLDGKRIGEPTEEKLQKLQPRYKREFATRFVIADSFFSQRLKTGDNSVGFMLSSI